MIISVAQYIVEAKQVSDDGLPGDRSPLDISLIHTI